MKKKVLFSIALAGLMLGSCSKDVIDNGGNGASWNENSRGYINLSLNLPSSDGSRSSRAEPAFQDGDEYRVENAILLLFVGNNETEAKFNSAYTLPLEKWNEDGSNTQITSSTRLVQEIKEIALSGTEKIYALVILNNNGIVTVGTDNAITVSTTDSSTEYTNESALTLAGLNTAIAGNASTTSWIKDNYFLMSNSPLFSKAGGASNLSEGECYTLVEINSGNICPTPEEAATKPAASIYVERAQAKIQVKADNTESSFTIKDKDGKEVTYKYKILNWDINNYNTKSFLTRNFDTNWASFQNGANGYRFVEGTAVRPDAIDTDKRYRTYWGKDVNYNSEYPVSNGQATLTKVSKNEDSGGLDLKQTIGSSAYCFENTNDLTYAMGKYYTSVIVSAQLSKVIDGTGSTTTTEGSDFYTVNDDRSMVYFPESAGYGGSQPSIEDAIKQHILNDLNVQAAIKDYIEGGTLSDNQINIDLLSVEPGDEQAANITITLTDDVTYKTDPADSETQMMAAINTAKTKKFDISYYKEGVCYYNVFIRHFDDTKAPLVDESTQESDHLGRYGVLRNNWYVINVKSIKDIGSPLDPVDPEEPVDEDKQYISVDINILAWAMRYQDVDL